jgi:hypothetical protein
MNAAIPTAKGTRHQPPAECGTRSGYTAHQRRGETPCASCREACAAAMRLRRASQRQPCEVCCRVHPGRCASIDERSKQVTFTLPGGVHQLLTERVPWGERSSFVAGLVTEALEEG